MRLIFVLLSYLLCGMSFFSCNRLDDENSSTGSSELYFINEPLTNTHQNKDSNKQTSDLDNLRPEPQTIKRPSNEVIPPKPTATKNDVIPPKPTTTKNEVIPPKPTTTKNEVISPKPTTSNDVSDNDDIARLNQLKLDPQLQLHDKNAEELETEAQSLFDSVKAKDWPSIFRLLKIRVLQDDKEKIDKIITYFLRNNLDGLTQFIKEAENRNKKMAETLSGYADKVTHKTSKLLATLRAVNLKEIILIASIKGIASGIATRYDIDLPPDFD